VIPTAYLDGVRRLAERVIDVRCDDGFALLADMGAEHADPHGWWLAFIFIDPAVRGVGAGTELLLATFAQLDVAPFVARKRGRPAVWSGHGRWGYELADRPWRFPGLSPRTHSLYIADHTG
jgi:GNAT superfamily N-acetyltransferase